MKKLLIYTSILVICVVLGFVGEERAMALVTDNTNAFTTVDNIKSEMIIKTTTIEENDSKKGWSETQKRYCETPVKVEVSHYSTNEETDEPGCEALGSTGRVLKMGDIAMPYEFPPDTQVKLKNSDGSYITDSNGSPMTFTNADRGNPSIVTTYNSPDRYGNKMRIDRFMGNTSSEVLNRIGVKNCTMEVTRWGSQQNIDLSNKITVKEKSTTINTSIIMTIE